MAISPQREFLKLIAKTIRIEFYAGDSTLVVAPHATGWRAMPCLVVAQTDNQAIIERTGNSTQKVEGGEAFALAPQVHHNITVTSRRRGYSHWVHFQCEVFSGVSLFYLVEPPVIFKGSHAKKIGKMCRGLGTLINEELSLAAVVKQQAIGWDLICSLLQTIELKEDRIDLIRQASRLSPVLAYIEGNLSQPISHELLAKTASLSPSRFHFLFRSALGCAPYEYVQKVRLKKAQELLIRTDLSVAEIGQDVGHPDPFHFSRTFRQKVGISPVKYRQQMKFGSF